ncbi:MAG: aminomethyl-transferring glycine dehydrogenase subunit GcvPA [Candidatus Thorarchaeota archaeon]|nr:aminomethyl-transferring glycine dehydrogenase subunit GcvPA [Candidatus Thorarchaeota archaeon]
MSWKHPWISVTEETQQEMLKSIGKKDFEDLFCNIPEKFRLRREMNLPDSHSEIEVTQRILELAQKNTPANDGRVFLGAGIGPHYIPAAVTSLAGRSEFVTSYTSYQPEISQGMLQTLFEYQSLMAELLEIDVVNSSMYDMATSLAEAIRMTVRAKNRFRFLVPGTVNPEHLRVAETYTEPVDITIQKVGYDSKTGLMSLEDLQEKLDDTVAGVYIENPSHLGFLESQVDQIAELTQNAGALLVVGVDITSLGLIRPPGDYNADIVIAEGQPLGVPISYGGPLLGIFGCRNERKLVYQMPGRLVGLTRTTEEPYDRGFVLTLSPREQHIRREKATSNICSNQALMAVTAAIYTSLLGKTGFKELGETILYKANYAAKQLNDIAGVNAPAIGDAIWKEFVVQFENGVTTEQVHQALMKNNLHGGVKLTEFPELGEAMLFCVTELHTKETIDDLVDTVRSVVDGGAN